MKMSLHTNDWCHLCGKRQPYLVDVWYPENAEQERQKPKSFNRDREHQYEYLRICRTCIDTLLRVATGLGDEKEEGG